MHQALTILQKDSVLSGYEDGTFRPNRQVTRGQMAKMIAVSLNLSATNATLHFTDLPISHANYKYVQALVAKKIINGYPDGSFKPNQVVTRAQAAKMIATAYQIPVYKETLPFKDITATSERYQHVQSLYFNGITGGTTATTYSPNNPVTRGQAALFIYRANSFKKGAVVHEIPFTNAKSIEIISQDGLFFKSVVAGNKLRLLPLENGSGLLFIKHDGQYTMYAIQANNQKITRNAVDWHNYVNVKFNYYSKANLQLSFTPTTITVKNQSNQIVSNELYFFDANDAGVEFALLSPGSYSITLANGHGQSKTFQATADFNSLTLKTTIYQ